MLNPSDGKPIEAVKAPPPSTGPVKHPVRDEASQSSAPFKGRPRLTAIVGSGFDAEGLGGTALVYETSDPAHGGCGATLAQNGQHMPRPVWARNSASCLLNVLVRAVRRND